MIPDDVLRAMRERREECVNRRHGDVCECHYDLPTALGEIDRLKVENEKLTAELAAKEIRWTDKKPTTEGAYWRRITGEPESAQVIELTRDDDGGLCGRWFLSLDALAKYEHEWSDKPISQPEERT